jgi:predicted amidohydrolase
MKIAVVQHDISWETPEKNFEALRPQIAAAAETGAGLIALTETFSWGFTMNTTIDGLPARSSCCDRRVGRWLDSCRRGRCRTTEQSDDVRWPER